MAVAKFIKTKRHLLYNYSQVEFVFDTNLLIMKKLNKFFLFLVLIFTTSQFLNAANFSIRVVDQDKIAIATPAVNHSPLQISILNKHGEVFHEEVVSAEAISDRLFHVGLYPDDSYTVVATFDNSIRAQTINVLANNVTLESTELKTLFYPTIVKSDNFLDINMMAFGDLEVSIEVVDEHGGSIYDLQPSERGPIHVRLNVKRLYDQPYFLDIKVQGENMFYHYRSAIDEPELASVMNSRFGK